MEGRFQFSTRWLGTEATGRWNLSDKREGGQEGAMRMSVGMLFQAEGTEVQSSRGGSMHSTF